MLYISNQARKFIFSREMNDRYQDYDVEEMKEINVYFHLSSFVITITVTAVTMNKTSHLFAFFITFVFTCFQKVFAYTKQHLETALCTYLLQLIQFVLSTILQKLKSCIWYYKKTKWQQKSVPKIKQL